MLIGVCLQWCVAGLGTGSWKSAQFVGIGSISSKQGPPSALSAHPGHLVGLDRAGHSVFVYLDIQLHAG